MVLKSVNPAAVLLASTVIVGFGGMVGQLLLLRELLVAFYGNELTLGVTLGSWLVLEAVGASLAGRRVKECFVFPSYAAGMLVYPLFLILGLYYCRGLAQSLFSLLPGEAAGFGPLILASLLVLGFPSLVHGALFAQGNQLLARLLPEHRRKSPGRVYLYETVGSMLGGLLFSFFLAQYSPAMFVAMVLAVLHLFVVLLLLVFIRPGRFARITVTFILALVLLLLPILPFLANDLHHRSLARQWPGREIVHDENTPYGSIVITTGGGEATLHYDGRPSLTLPHPHRARLDEYAAFAAASCDLPGTVLLLGGGAGGLLEALLVHPLAEIYYLELDPRLPALVREGKLPGGEEALLDKRVNLIEGDARRFMAHTSVSFDLVVYGFLHPDTLQENRLFTLEFMQIVHARLRPGGIFFFSAPGAPYHYTPDSLPLNASLWKTASTVFPSVMALPGEETLFWASTEPLEVTPSAIEKRLEERGLSGGFLTREYLELRFDPLRQDNLLADLERCPARINLDYRPSAFYYSLMRWGSFYSLRLFSFLRWLEGLPLLGLGLLVAAVVGGGLFRNATLKKTDSLIHFAVFSTGISGMAFDLLLIFLLQVIFGYAYQMMGLLIGAYMGGAALGGALGLKMVSLSVRGSHLVALEAILFLMHPVLFGLAAVFSACGTSLPEAAMVGGIAIFALISGMATGVLFAPAAALVRIEGRRNDPASSLYAADLVGGWLGGVLVSLLLFPLLGLGGTLLLLGVLKLCSLAATAFAWRRGA